MGLQIIRFCIVLDLNMLPAHSFVTSLWFWPGLQKIIKRTRLSKKNIRLGFSPDSAILLCSWTEHIFLHYNNFSNETNFTFSAYCTTKPQMIFDLGMWPFHLINKWRFPYCIYDPTLVEIHQSMWKVQPNVHPFSQSMTTTTTYNNNNSQWKRWSLCLFC